MTQRADSPWNELCCAAGKLEDSLVSFSAHAARKVGAQGWQTFFLDGVTAILTTVPKGEPEKANFSGTGEVPQLVSEAFRKQTCVWEEEYQKRVALPLLLPDNTAVGVISFTFAGDTQEILDKVPVGEFWAELQSDGRKALYRWLQAKVWEDVRLAGGAPLYLKHRVDEFINGFRKAYKESGWPAPDMMYLQLVDHYQQTIRTIHGFGMPLSFEYLPAHSLDSEDIQSLVVRYRCPECIAGNDKDRFDQRIFEQYGHHEYSRLWFPLFPLPKLGNGETDSLGNYFQEKLTWHPPESGDDFEKILADWTHGDVPPAELVFGTVEIGYRGKDLSRWTPEHTAWAMATGCTLGKELFLATHAGALEQMGRALTRLAPRKNLEFQYAASHGRIVETRHYPAPTPWLTAIPTRISQMETEEQRAIDGEVHLNWHGKDQPPIEPVSMASPCGMPGIREEAMRRASRAAEVALHLFRGVVYPQELVVPDRSPIAMGIAVDDNTVSSICAEAVQMTGAQRCFAFFYENRRKDNEPPVWETRWPFMTYPSETIPDGMSHDLIDLIEREARKVAEHKQGNYDCTVGSGAAKYPLVFLPLEFSKVAVGVLALSFSGEQLFRFSAISDLERRIPRWAYRIMILDLISHNSFAALTAVLREGISEAHKKACADFSRLDSDCVQTFIEEVLCLSANTVNPDAVWLTVCERRSLDGFTRVERYWYVNSADRDAKSQVQRYPFSPTELSGPCQEACDNGKPVIYSGEKKTEKIVNLIATLTQEAEKQQERNDSETAEGLRAFARAIEPDLSGSSSSTIITFPVIRRGEKEPRSRTAFTWVIRGDYYFDEEHRALLTELGEVLAEFLHQVRQTGMRRQEEKFNSSLEDFGQELGRSNTLDEAFGIFLRFLASRSEGGALAEDAVIWLVSNDRSQLVARSGRGTPLAPLEKKSRDVLKIGDHPSQGFQPTLSSPEMNYESPFFLVKKLTGHDSSVPGIYFKDAHLDRQWFLSFPLRDASGDVYGVVDCLRDQPLTEVEEEVMERLFIRASVQLHSKLTELRFRQTGEITNQLFMTTEKCLGEFRTDAAYNEIVRQIRDFFWCEHCDLFLHRLGKMFLYATTRESGPFEDTERFRFEVQKEDSAEELLAICQSRKSAMIYHWQRQKKNIYSSHFSDALRQLLESTLGSERLAVPLQDGVAPSSAVVGMLHIVGPRKRPKGASIEETKYLKRTLRFTDEDFQLAKVLAPSLQRILRTVRLAEQQGWLVRDLGHSIGHPLQTLRSAVNNMLRSLSEGKPVDYLQRRQMKAEVEYAFRIVADARDRWGFFTTPRQPGQEYDFKEVKLKDFVQLCCDFLAPAAALGKNRITYPQLQILEPVPVEERWLRVAIINLLENACKYSWFERQIVVSLTETKDGWISITIRNWGVGIPQEDLITKKIFQPYYRSRVPDARGTRPGSGIGLAIVRIAIEEVHGGEIAVESIPERHMQTAGRGSLDDVCNVEHVTTFTIRLNRIKLKSIALHDLLKTGEGYD